jgi:hypothetical protein
MSVKTRTLIPFARPGHLRRFLSCTAAVLLLTQGSTLAQDAPEKVKPPADPDPAGSEKPSTDQPSGEEAQPGEAPVQEKEEPKTQEETPPADEPTAPPEQAAEQPGEEAQAATEAPVSETEVAAEPPAEATAPGPQPKAAAPGPTVPIPPSGPSRTPIVTTSTPSSGTEPLVPRGLVAAELGFAATSLDGYTGYWISPLLSGWFRLERTIAIEAEWGSVALLASPDPDSNRSGIGAGNPYLGFYSVRQHGPTVLRVGVGMTIPVATISGDSRIADWNTYQGAMAMRGMWRWWLWVPDSLSLAIPVSWDSEIAGRWLWGGEGALAATVILPKPARSTVFLRDEPRTADLLIPLELYAGYRTGKLVAGGRLQAVFVATGETELQLSLSPYGKLELGQGFLEARFTANIDRPLGFAFEKGRFWGIHLGGGYGFK